MPENKASEKVQLEITKEQALNLQESMELLKALASPARLALVGIVASNFKRAFTIQELAEATGQAPHYLVKDLQLAVKAGLVTIQEWSEPKPGREPEPVSMIFNQEALKRLPALIGTLHSLSKGAMPPEEMKPKDEKAQTLERFIKNGRLVGWPVQVKRQLFLLEEISKLFEAGIEYREREVDEILKRIYEEDHCTLRRNLVDYKYLSRYNGIYRKVVYLG
jgi:hypothetical protein